MKISSGNIAIGVSASEASKSSVRHEASVLDPKSSTVKQKMRRHRDVVAKVLAATTFAIFSATAATAQNQPLGTLCDSATSPAHELMYLLNLQPSPIATTIHPGVGPNGPPVTVKLAQTLNAITQTLHDGGSLALQSALVVRATELTSRLNPDEPVFEMSLIASIRKALADIALDGESLDLYATNMDRLPVCMVLCDGAADVNLQSILTCTERF